jgi:hypothetical protein
MQRRQESPWTTLELPLIWAVFPVLLGLLPSWELLTRLLQRCRQVGGHGRIRLRLAAKHLLSEMV